MLHSFNKQKKEMRVDPSRCIDKISLFINQVDPDMTLCAHDYVFCLIANLLQNANYSEFRWV